MNWQFTPYLLLPLLAAILLGALAFFGWRRRPAPGASAFVLLMLSVAEWSLGNALELGTADLPGKIFWLYIEYIGIVALPAAWLIFALQYTERGNWLTRRTLTLLAVEPALALILLWTTNFHGLFFKSFGLDTRGPVPQWDGVNGVGYWINIIYSYILIFTGTLILLQALVRPQGSRLYRWRAIAVLAGVLSPWVANVLYAFYGLPLPGLDPTPFALAVTGLAFAWGIFRLQLFDIAPAAHEAVPENLSEWREQVLDNILNGVLVFGLLVLAGGINNVIQAYRQAASLYDRPLVLAFAIITAYVAATLAVFIAAFWRGPGYAWRAGTLLFVFYGLGALGLALSGLSGDGRLFLFAFVILTAILFDLPYGLGALTLSVLTFAVMAWLLVNGAIQLPGLRQANPVDPSAWWSGGLVFVLLTIGAATSVTYLMRRLEHSLTQAQTELAERQRAEAALRENEKNAQSLLRLSKRLEQAQTYTEALDAVLDEVKTVLDCQTAWVYLISEDRQYAHLLSTRGKQSQNGIEELPILTIKGDRFLEEIAASNDIIVVEDARTDPRTNKEIVAWLGNRTILNAPIMLMDRHLGVLGTGTFGDEGVRPPTQKQLDFLRAMASHLAVALDRIHLFTERQRAEEGLLASEARLQRLNRVLRAISAINQLIVRERNRGRLLAEACQIFIRERNCSFVWLGLLEADGATVRLAAASGPANPAHFHFRLDETGPGPACAPAALRARAPFRVEPSLEHDPCPNCPLRVHIPQRSSVALPLALGERIYGVMVIHGPTPDFFDAEEIGLLQELADDLAYALEKLEADEQRRARENELASLLDAARAVSTRLDPDEVLQQLAHSMTSALRLESCTLSAYDPETRGTLTLVHFSTLSESDTNDVGRLYPLAEYPATARAIAQDEALIVRAGDRQADLAEVTLLRRLGLAVLLMFPLRVGGRVVGLAELYTRDEGREFTPAELRLARTLADQAAVALENARLFSETQTKAAELSRLYAAAQDMTTSLESPRLLELLAKHLVEAFGATSAYIGSVDVNQATETMVAEYWAEAATPAERNSDLGRAFSLRHYPTVLRAALSGQTITLQADAPDLSEAERRQFAAYAVQTMLFVPITAHGRLLALAEVWESRRKRLFTPAEMRLAQALAAHAGSAIENAQLFAEMAATLTREQHLNAIARLISGTLDQPTLLQNVVRLAAELIGAEAGAMALVAPDGLTMTIPYLHNLPEGLGSELAPAGVGLAWRIVESGETILVDDFSVHPDVRPEWAAIGLRGFVGAPVVAGEARLGAIGLFSLRSAKRFTERDAALAEAVGQQAGLAIRNAQLFEAGQQRVAELETVAHIAATLREAQTRDDILALFLRKTMDDLQADGGALLLLEGAGHGTLTVAATHGLAETLIGQQQEPDDGFLWEAVRSGEAIFVPDTAAPEVRWPSPLGRALIAGMRACACIPLKTAEATIGLMHLTSRTPRAPTPAERRLLAALAEMAGNALHRATLHEQTEQRLQHLNALHTIDLAISSNLNLNVTLNVFLDQVMAQLRPDAAAVLLFDAPTQMLDYAAGRGFRTDALQHTHIRLGESYAGRAALQQETITIPDLRQHKTGFLRSPLFALEGFLAYHALPLIAKGQVQGVLEIFHRAPTTHNPDWWDFLKALAVQVAIALDNATLFTNVQHSNIELSLAYDTTLEGWAMALELRDQETAGHTRRVTELAVRVARALGMKDDELLHLRRGALLHDIGKMGLPDSILLKPGPLTDDEQAFMRQHPQFAYNMLFPIAFLRSALDIPYYHHEKWDGTGYPRGLKGETIPLSARIFAVVDIWDALCSNRPYRPAWPRHEVREHISALAGTHFDPRVVEVFLRLLDDFEPM